MFTHSYSEGTCFNILVVRKKTASKRLIFILYRLKYKRLMCCCIQYSDLKFFLYSIYLPTDPTIEIILGGWSRATMVAQFYTLYFLAVQSLLLCVSNQKQKKMYRNGRKTLSLYIIKCM